MSVAISKVAYQKYFTLIHTYQKLSHLEVDKQCHNYISMSKLKEEKGALHVHFKSKYSRLLLTFRDWWLDVHSWKCIYSVYHPKLSQRLCVKRHFMLLLRSFSFSKPKKWNMNSSWSKPLVLPPISVNVDTVFLIVLTADLRTIFFLKFRSWYQQTQHQEYEN